MSFTGKNRILRKIDMTTTQRKIFTLLILLMTFAMVATVLSACAGGVNEFSQYVVVNRDGLHEGDALPEISLEGYMGSVEWETPEQLIVGGNNDYNYIYTDVYGEEFVGVVTIYATYHVFSEYEVILEPTCTEAGLQYVVCEICGEVYAIETIPATGHDFSVHMYDDGDCQHQSCTWWACSVCGTPETDENGDIVCTYGDYGDCVWATDDDGNYIVLDEDVIVAPTCSSSGSGYVRCIYYDICGSTMEVDIEPTECLYEDEVYNEGDCCTYGYTEYRCVYCGDYLMDPDNADETYKLYDSEYGDHQYEYGICALCGAVDTTGYDVQFALTSTRGTTIYANLYLYATNSTTGAEYYNMVIYGSGTISDSNTISWLYDKVKFNGINYTYSQLIRNVTVIEGVTGLTYGMFEGCSALQTVNLPDGIAEIPDYTFKNCVQLSAINIPDSVIAIGDEAFYNCNLLSLDISSLSTELEDIGKYAFYNCNCIYGLDFSAFTDSYYGNLQIDYMAFVGADSVGYVVLTDCIVLSTGVVFDDSVTIFALFDDDGSLSNYSNVYYLGDGAVFSESVAFDDDGNFYIID